MEEQRPDQDCNEPIYDKQNRLANIRALERVQAMSLPIKVDLTDGNLTGVSSSHDRAATRLLKRFIERHPDDPAIVVALAVRLVWFALWSGAEYVNQDSVLLRTLDPSRERLDVTALAYGQREGFAYALYNELSNTSESAEVAALRIECGVKERLPPEDLMEAASLYWSALAVDALRKGDRVAGMEWLYESGDAMNLAAGLVTWGLATKEFEEQMALRTRSATNARLAFGEKSRNKLFEAAGKYRGRMPKEAAAARIAEEIGKSPATVRRELSKQFPGESWKVSNDQSVLDDDLSR